MTNVILKNKLEEIALCLREILEIEQDEIININAKELAEKIENKFPNYKVEFSNFVGLTLDCKECFTIYIDAGKNQFGVKHEAIYDLIRVFTYSIIFDKKSLKHYQLMRSEFSESAIMKDEDAEYLMLAFILPEKLFLREFIKYSRNDGTVDIFTMEEKVDKYVYRRGKDLGYWT